MYGCLVGAIALCKPDQGRRLPQSNGPLQSRMPCRMPDSIDSGQWRSGRRALPGRSMSASRGIAFGQRSGALIARRCLCFPHGLRPQWSHRKLCCNSLHSDRGGMFV